MKLSSVYRYALAQYWQQRFGKQIPSEADFNATMLSSANSGNADSNNIFMLISKIQHELVRLGVNQHTLEKYIRCGLAPIAYYFSELPECKYSVELLDEFVAEIYRLRSAFRISHYAHLIFQRGYRFMVAYKTFGRLEMHDLRKAGKRAYIVDPAYEKLIRQFEEGIGDYRSYAAHTMESTCGSVRAFLFHLEQSGVTNIENITRQGINDCVTEYAKCLNNGIKPTLHHLRVFFQFLFDEGILPENLSDAVPKFSPRRNVVIQGFGADEADLMLNAADRDMPKGKRDYAIMMIAAKTGLRAVDIARLTFQNINWRTNEINLIQKKTGNPLSLPLMPEVGNAIASYILAARPKSPSEYIFISTSNVLKPISRQTVCSLAYKYKKLAGIDDSGGINRAFHSFRRGFALSLLESSANAPMIGEMLGDVNINSIKPYLAISEAGLMDCGIKLSSLYDEAPRGEAEVANNA